MENTIMIYDSPATVAEKILSICEKEGISVEIANTDICKVDDLILDDRRKMVTVNGRDTHLTPIEYEILRLLAGQRGRVFTTKQIYEHVWKMKPIREDRTVMAHICHIRKKIEANPRRPRYLKSVWGMGYKIN